MAPFYANFKREDLERFKAPAMLFGAGFLAGLLIFLVWLALLPDSSKAFLAAQPATAVGVAQKPLGDDDGVLAGIAGKAKPGRRAKAPGTASDAEATADQAATDELAAEPSADPAADPGSDGFEEISDEQAIADGLLDAPAQESDEAASDPDAQADFNAPESSR